MLYRKVKKTGDELSILGYGCMRYPKRGNKIDEERTVRQIRSAIEQGINYFDTAWTYHHGESETVLGRALSGGYRERVKIADKMPHWLCRSRDDMEFYLEEQLKRLNTDRIDYYLIHAVDEESWFRLRELGVVDFFEDSIKQGKIVNAGFSYHGSREGFKRVVDDYDWSFCQIQYNILDEYNQAGREGLRYAAARDIAVFVMGPLRGGYLAGALPEEVEKIYNSSPVKRQPVEWALRWIWDQPGVVTILSGMNCEDDIAENVRIAGEAQVESLTSLELDIIRQAAEKFRSILKIGCTGCQYCMPCPANVDIPFAFEKFNSYYLFKKNRTISFRGTYLFQAGGYRGKPVLPGQCNSCGLCIKSCPQDIDIPRELVKVKKKFETPLLRFLVKTVIKRMK